MTTADGDINPHPFVRDDGMVALHIRPGGNAVILWYLNPVEGYDDMAKLREWAAMCEAQAEGQEGTADKDG